MAFIHRTIGILGVAAACGPTSPQDDTTTTTTASTGETTDGTTDPTAPTSEPTTGETTAPTTTTTPPECDGYFDCDHLYCGYCDNDGVCRESVGCCGDYAQPVRDEHGWRCQPPPECYSDEECPPDEYCDGFVCVPVSLPQLRPCQDTPVNVSDWNLGFAPGAFVLADLDADGDLDLAAAQPSVASVEVAFNDGAGNFAVGNSFSVGGPAPALAIDAGDLDDDGDLDLAIVRGDAGGGLILALAQAGVFTPQPTLPTEPMPTGVLVRELEDDAFDDVITIGPTQVTTRRGNALADFSMELVAITDTVDPRATAFDVDRDGRLDLFAPLSGTTAVGVWLGEADGTFLPSLSIDPLVASPAALVGDLVAVDGGPPTLVFGRAVGDTGQIDVWRGNDAPEMFDPPVTFFTSLPIAGGALVELAEPAGPDLLAATGQASVLLALGDGAGGFSCERILAVDAPTSQPLLVAGDVDGDGRADIVAGDANSTLVRVVRMQ